MRFAHEQAPAASARHAMAPLSEAEAFSGEVERIAAISARTRSDPARREDLPRDVGSFAPAVCPRTIVFHGTADHVSDPINEDQVTQRWITTNSLASPGGFTAAYEHPSQVPTRHPAGPDGERPYTMDAWQDAHGRNVVTYYKVAGIGHAWSSSTPGSVFTDPWGPDASEAMYEFGIAHPEQTGK